MSWKYVLVGLTLVLHGNLLLVQARERLGLRDAGDEGSALKSLIQYFRDRRLGREPYEATGQEDARLVQDVVQDVEESKPGEVLPDSAPVNSHRKTPGTQPKEEETEAGDGAGGGGGSSSSSSSGSKSAPSNQEVNSQVEEEGMPRALPMTHRHGMGSSSNAATGNSMYFIMIVTGCTVLAAIGIVGAGVCWYKYHKRAKSAGVVEYPAYGVTGPTKDHLPSPGDRKLAQSAQMYHYQHQKQQMIAMEKANGSMKHDASDEESEEDNVEGDYTVYECPGLAPTGEMEVKNPLFRGDETPTSTPVNEEPPQQPPQDK
ncbi:uncharacterized protein LOC143289983 isoform X2 [Babylonia areolata]|uniref:uncharacterized protein LOC143289983 isoform X2 n=1 Tax=Babylonia areolata TaxID=304850 RepID=UPI003FD1962B